LRVGSDPLQNLFVDILARLSSETRDGGRLKFC